MTLVPGKFSVTQGCKLVSHSHTCHPSEALEGTVTLKILPDVVSSKKKKKKEGEKHSTVTISAIIEQFFKKEKRMIANLTPLSIMSCRKPQIKTFLVCVNRRVMPIRINKQRATSLFLTPSPTDTYQFT